MMTPTAIIHEINRIARRRFHRLPIEFRRAVVGSLEGLDRIGPRDVEAALAEARRRKELKRGV